MIDKRDVPQGTLALMVLKTIEAMGPRHGYGVAATVILSRFLAPEEP